jgi:hypothetical protein
MKFAAVYSLLNEWLIEYIEILPLMCRTSKFSFTTDTFVEVASSTERYLK